MDEYIKHDKVKLHMFAFLFRQTFPSEMSRSFSGPTYVFNAYIFSSFFVFDEHNGTPQTQITKLMIETGYIQRWLMKVFHVGYHMS